MIGRLGSSRDSSFLCLLAIYATHVLLFHVLAVAPLMDVSKARRELSPSGPTSSNATRHLQLAQDQSLAAAAQQLHHHQVFVRSSSARFWESSISNILNNYPKALLDYSLLSHYFHRVKSVFTIEAWSSSTWGIISGCAIFILTYTEREYT